MTYTGLVNGDAAPATPPTVTTTATAASDVGTYPITASGAVDANYTISYVGGILTVTPLAVTVTADAQTKVYGSADPALTYTVAPALVAGDTFAGGLARAPGENVGTYAILQGTLELSANYALAFTGADFTITKATPTVVTWPSASAILLGQTIGEAVLSGGEASVPGTFAFDVPGTAPGLGTASYAMTFTPADTLNYETVSGSVPVTVHVAPVLDEIADKIVDELTELVFTATATDLDQPPQDLFFTLDAASLAAGMTINTNTGRFSWTPSELQGPGVYTVTITVTDADSEGPAITPLVRESFEELPLGSSVNGINGWVGTGATVVNDPAGPAGYVGELPLSGDHTQTLQVTAPLELNANGTGITTLDLMISPEPVGELPDVPAEMQSAFGFNAAGDLLVFHCTNTPTGYARGWSVITLADKVQSGEWVRLTLVTDYITSDPPNPMFQLGINGVSVSSPLAKQSPDIDGTAGGTWFIGASGTTVGGGAVQFNALSTTGSYVLDDVVLDSETPVSGGGNGGGLSDSVTFTITVNEVNLAPVANADSYLVAEGGTLSVPAAGVLANDTDADFPTNTLNAVLVTGPVNGGLTLNADGSFSYTHNGGETTSDSFTYQVFDGSSNSAPATVSITVTAVNDPPYVANALPDLVKQQDFEIFTVDLSEVFADAENNEPFTFSVSISGAEVLGAYVSGSTLTVTNDPGARGTATITVTATESGTSPALSGSTSFDVMVIFNVVAEQACLIHFKAPSQGLCTISNTLTYPAEAALTSLTWKPELLYPGWTVYSVTGDGAPVTDGTNIVFTAPEELSPTVVFSYTFAVPGNGFPTNILNAGVTFGFEGVPGTLTTAALPPLLLKRYHSADYQTMIGPFNTLAIPDWKIDSFEAQRFRQYSRIDLGSYHGTDVSSATPDGFTNGVAIAASWPHNGDYETFVSPFERYPVPDGKIHQFEVQRVFEIMRSGVGVDLGRYHLILDPAIPTPDGYGVGPD